jgi:peroxiredoxin
MLLPAMLLTVSCVQQKTETDFFSLKLQTVDHETFSFQTLESGKATAIIFLQPECPFCNSYGKTFRELDSATTKAGITFIAVVAGKNYPEEEIKVYREHNRFTFPILLDPDFVLQKRLNAIITPEVFLVSNTGETLYRGLIDNWAYEIGKVRPVVSEHYLMDAVTAFLKNRPIQPDSTKAIGCYIE